jgi:hypothetical protein
VNLLYSIFGAIVLPLLLSEFTDLSPWLAKTLVRRAARRIPEQERPRWEDDWLAELASKPGRLFKLLWALWSLPLLKGPGEMGRLLGAPPASEVIRARLRAAWHRLRFRPKAPAQQPDPEPVLAQAEAAHVVTLAPAAVTQLQAIGATRSGGTATLGNPPLDPEFTAWLDGTGREFTAWLAGQGRAFEAWVAQQHQQLDVDLDQISKEYEIRRDRELRG